MLPRALYTPAHVVNMEFKVFVSCAKGVLAHQEQQADVPQTTVTARTCPCLLTSAVTGAQPLREPALGREACSYEM